MTPNSGVVDNTVGMGQHWTGPFQLWAWITSVTDGQTNKVMIAIVCVLMKPESF